MNMDKMIGPDFEKGLARLKAVAEESGAPELTRRQTTVQVSPPLIRPASASRWSP